MTQRGVRGCNSALFSGNPDYNETDVSAIGDAPQAHARLSRADAQPRRAGSAACPPHEGSGAIERLSSSVFNLPRRARLQRREHYREALAAGASRVRRHFRLYVRPNGLAQARLGIIASSRVAARAVDRNRFKRMVREAFRIARPRLGGFDIVVQLRRCPEGSSAAGARSELARVLEELADRRT